MNNLQCEKCNQEFAIDTSQEVCDCGGLLEVRVDQPKLPLSDLKKLFEERYANRKRLEESGVWRYREMLPPFKDQEIVTRPEGNTPLYHHPLISKYAGIQSFWLKHEGENPTGSFKDRGMTVAMSRAKRKKSRAVACASTGNTSASLASYAALAQLPAMVFVPSGKIATGKLSQTLAYGAKTLLIRGDFDKAMSFVQEVCRKLDIELVNSINPFRLEGQKTIVWELLHQRNFDPPDWIVLPAGNLGNLSAFGKALLEARKWGFIKQLPRLAAIQAEGASPFFQSFAKNFSERISVQAKTIATAVQIGSPISFDRAVRSIRATNGIVITVNDQEILNAKAIIDRAGIGCEPASACTLAGVRKLVSENIIQANTQVVGILTGNLLKDPDTTLSFHNSEFKEIDDSYVNKPVEIPLDIKVVEKLLDTTA